jgi:hypothetical protein
MAWPARRARPGAAEPLPRLAPPPRRVPLTVKLRALFGGFGVFAWLWFGLGSSVATAFLRHADLTSWALFRGGAESAAGESLGCEDTGASEGGGKARRGTPIFANRYRFTSGGDTFEGVSYIAGRCIRAGAPVAVEHPAGRPELSRVAGMRRDEFGPEVGFAAIFPVVGLFLVGASLRKGRRQLRLLERGKLGLGTLLSAEPTNTRINERTVMKMRFALVTEVGARHEIVVRTHLPEKVQDEARERILYDPARPEDALAWDLLTSVPALDAAGGLEAKSVLGTALVLLPPLLAVAGHLVVLGVWMP